MGISCFAASSMNSTTLCPFQDRRSSSPEERSCWDSAMLLRRRTAPRPNTVSPPEYDEHGTTWLQLVFGLPETAFNRPAQGIVTQDLFIAKLPIGVEDNMEMIRRHRLIRLPSQPHHRILEAMDRFLAAIHRDEAGVVGLGELLRLDGDAVRVENSVRLEHGDDMESLVSNRLR